MSRPDFPRPYCVLPANCIRRIREEQESYDRDPEGYERRQRIREEAREEERRQLAELERQYWEEQQRLEDK